MGMCMRGKDLQNPPLDAVYLRTCGLLDNWGRTPSARGLGRAGPDPCLPVYVRTLYSHKYRSLRVRTMKSSAVQALCMTACCPHSPVGAAVSFAHRFCYSDTCG
jgi:hypothetical protein